MPTATPISMTVGAGDIAAIRTQVGLIYQEVIRVHWDDATVKNYANTSMNELTQFPGALTVFGVIEARIERDKWLDFKMSSLLADDSITLELTDPDETIKALARSSGEGQLVEVYSYYPQITVTNPDGLAVLRWWGLMRKPKDSDRYTFRAEVVAGYRSGNITTGRHQHPSCQATFGSYKLPGTSTFVFPTVAAVARNACPYDRGQGGSIGNLDGAVPYTSCPRDSTAACQDRLGADYYRWYLGFPNMGAYSYVRGKSFSFIARSENNQTIVRKRIPVVYGLTVLTDIEPITTQNQISPIAEYEDRGFLNTLYNICEGPTHSLDSAVTGHQYGMQQGIYYCRVNNKFVPTEHHYKFGGYRGETFVNEVRLLGYNLTAQVVANLNYGEFGARAPSEATMSCTVDGLSNIRVYSNPTTFVEQYTTVPAWCELDYLTNRRYGLRYDHSLFHIQDWINLASWDSQSIPMLQENGSTSSQVRSTLNVEIKERPAQQVVNDLCASHRHSLPFFFQGKIRIVGLGLEDLTSLLTFSEETTHGFTPNIRKGSLKHTPMSDDKIVNQVKVTYDEFAYNPNGDPITWDMYERSIIIDDEAQQNRAAVVLGDETKREIDGEMQAFGVKNFAEAARLCTARLHLGEHDQGGTKNPLEITFETTGHNADAFQLHQYRLIKVLDAAVNEYEEEDGTPCDTFRIKELNRRSDGWLVVTAQHYPRSYMAKLENGTYVIPLSWVATDRDYGRIIRRSPRTSGWRTMADGRGVRVVHGRPAGRTIDGGRVIIIPPTGTEQVETATIVGTVVVGGTVTVVVTAAGMTGSPKTLSPRLEGGITQRETGQVVGSIDTSGNAGVRVTAAGMTGSPITFTVPVLVGDQPYDVAQKMVIVLGADANLTALFDVRRQFDRIVLTRLTPAANDATLNIEIGNGSVFGIGSSCAGLTSELVSENTRAGTASGDTATIVATKITAALNADADIFEWFGITSSGADIILTRKKAAANDATMNLSYANGTCTGLTNDATSDNTRAGVAPP